MPITTSRVPAMRRAIDRFVEHRHERVDAFDREPLHADVRPAEEPLEPVDFGQPLEQRRFSSAVSGAVASPDSIVLRNHSRSASSFRCSNSYASVPQ